MAPFQGDCFDAGAALFWRCATKAPSGEPVEPGEHEGPSLISRAIPTLHT